MRCSITAFSIQGLARFLRRWVSFPSKLIAASLVFTVVWLDFAGRLLVYAQSASPSTYLPDSVTADRFASTLKHNHHRSDEGAGHLKILIPASGRAPYELRRLIERLHRHGFSIEVIRVSDRVYQYLNNAQNGPLDDETLNELVPTNPTDEVKELHQIVSNSHIHPIKFNPEERIIHPLDFVDMMFGVQTGSLFWQHFIRGYDEIKRNPQGNLIRRAMARLQASRKYHFDWKIFQANAIKTFIYLATFLPIALTQRSITDPRIWNPVLFRSSMIWLFGFNSREFNDFFSQRVATSIQSAKPKVLERKGVERNVSRTKINQGFMFATGYAVNLTFTLIVVALFQGGSFGLDDIMQSAKATAFSTLAFMPFMKVSLVLHEKSRTAYDKMLREGAKLSLDDEERRRITAFKTEGEKAHFFANRIQNGRTLLRAYESNLYLSQFLEMSLRILAPFLTNLFLFLDPQMVIGGVPVGQLRDRPLEILGVLGLVYDMIINRVHGWKNLGSDMRHFCSSKMNKLLSSRTAKRLVPGINLFSLPNTSRPCEAILLTPLEHGVKD